MFIATRHCTLNIVTSLWKICDIYENNSSWDIYKNNSPWKQIITTWRICNTGLFWPTDNNWWMIRRLHVTFIRLDSSTILHLGIRWKWVASFRPLPLYPRGKSHRYPLRRSLGGPKSRSGRCGKERKLLSLTEIETQWPLYRLNHPSSVRLHTITIFIREKWVY
jgi:hypothetical protein